MPESITERYRRAAMGVRIAGPPPAPPPAPPPPPPPAGFRTDDPARPRPMNAEDIRRRLAAAVPTREQLVSRQPAPQRQGPVVQSSREAEELMNARLRNAGRR